MKKYLFFLIATLAFVACSDDADVVQQKEVNVPEVGSPESLAGVNGFFSWENPYARDMSFNPDDFTFSSWDGFHVKNSYDYTTPSIVVINSSKELDEVYLGDRELPEIDYKKYTLVMGVLAAPTLSYWIESISLDVHSENLLMGFDVRGWDSGFTAIARLGFWRLYPKLPNLPITPEVKVTVLPDSDSEE